MIEGKIRLFLRCSDFRLSCCSSDLNRYTYEDEITVQPSMPNYQEKLKMFFAEHLHSDEEIRLVLEGSGFFDVRDKNDKWMRIHVFQGDLIILPAGKLKNIWWSVVVSFLSFKEFTIVLSLIVIIIFVHDVSLLVNLFGRRSIVLKVINIHRERIM